MAMTDATTSDQMTVELMTDGDRIDEVNLSDPGIIEFLLDGQLTGGRIDMIRNHGWVVRKVAPKADGRLWVRIHRDLAYTD